MADDPNLAVDTLYDIAKMGGNDFSGKPIAKDAVPTEIMDALKKWVDSVNIELADVDDEAYVGSWFDDERTYYAFTFSVSEPEAFVGTLAIGAVAPDQVGVLGVSSSGSS